MHAVPLLRWLKPYRPEIEATAWLLLVTSLIVADIVLLTLLSTGIVWMGAWLLSM
jgi:hypothetical protein